MNRTYAATKMNHQSSRSHALYRLTVQSMSKHGINVEDLSALSANMDALTQPTENTTAVVVRLCPFRGDHGCAVELHRPCGV